MKLHAKLKELPQKVRNCACRWDLRGRTGRACWFIEDWAALATRPPRLEISKNGRMRVPMRGCGHLSASRLCLFRSTKKPSISRQYIRQQGVQITIRPHNMLFIFSVSQTPSLWLLLCYYQHHHTFPTTTLRIDNRAPIATSSPWSP